jgi:hypothetical protein
MRLLKLAQATMLLFSLQSWGFAQTSTPTLSAASKNVLHFGQAFFRSFKAKPVRHWFERYRDSNSGEMDEYHIAVYQGFRTEFIRSKAYPRDELSSLVIQNPSIRLPLGIKFGDSPKKVIEILGPPTSEKPEEIRYDDGMPIAEIIIFRFTREHLIELELIYDHD